MARLRGGQAVARALHAEGIDTVFGIVGTHNSLIFDGLTDVPDVRVVTTRHEGGAGFMADGFARATRRPAAAIVVPGHGPITDAKGALAVRDYLVYVRDEARRRFDAGLSPADAARDIALAGYAAWGDAERIAVNVHTLYKEWSGGAQGGANALELFSLMGELRKRGQTRGG